MRLYKRKTASLSAAFVFGIAVAEYGRIPFGYVLLLSGGTGAVLAVCFRMGEEKPKRRHMACFAAVLAAAAVCGSCNSMLCQSFCAGYESWLKDGDICLLQGEIDQKEEDGKSCLYYLKKCRVRSAKGRYSCGKVLAYLDVCDYSIGEILCIKGNVKYFSQPANEGGYDERAYYRSQKTGFKIYAQKAVAVYGRRDAFRERLWSVKEKIKKSYQDAMPDADAGVLAAMVLGDKSGMDRGRKLLYQKAGISHFYSISGLHISLLGLAVYQFLKKRDASGWLSCGLASVWILSYGEMVGFGVSASRAIGMFLLLMYAKCRGRSYDRVTALFLMAAVLSGENPGLLHHAGFLLSFGAVSGVVLAEGLLERDTELKQVSKIHKIGKKLRETLVVSACIQMVTIPVMCCFFYEISVYTVFLNLLVLPCMGILLGMGILGGIAGLCVPSAAKLVLYPCHLVLLWYEAACKGVLRLPGAVLITGKLSVGRLICWYGCVALFLLAEKNVFQNFVFRFLGRTALLLVLGLLLLVQPARQFEIDVLDVGQGDGIYISTGDGAALFLDGGSTDVKNAGAYRILPFLKYRGIRSVDYWFVSHCDADHINGLCEVMEAGYQIKCLVVSEFMPEDKASRALKELAEQKRIPVLAMGPGDAIKGGKGGWSCKCISVKGTWAKEDRNANSLVFLYESEECRAFFGGDIASGQEEALLAGRKLPEVDFYKASHHGSDFSNSKAVLDVLKPEIAVISCSLYNSYGHPGKEALKRLEETAGRIYQTRYLGQIKITGVHLEEEVSGMLKCRYEDD